MRYRIEQARCRDYSVSSRLEWVLPNGLGGFAMGSVAGTNTRRYHGHLVAAIKPPTHRMVLLSAIEAYATVNGNTYGISSNQYSGAVHPQGYTLIEEFSVGKYAEWVFLLDGERIRKRLAIHQGADACTVEYTNLAGVPVQLGLRPLVCHKFYHDNFRITDFYPEFLVFPQDKTILSHEGVSLVLNHPAAQRSPTTGWYYRFERPREAERGLDPVDDLFCPCELGYLLAPGETVRLSASTQESTEPTVIPVQKDSSESLLDELRTAARMFLVTAPERTTIIGGYPWFTDWGRDTMIALPGVCLATGEVGEAREILRAYASQMKQGLIPNRFVDKGETPDYNTVDATLWFANAIHQTLEADWDEKFGRECFGWLKEAFEWHVKGTMFGIQVDPSDGLLTQGASGFQLTWMDAKVGDWVVTPRHGKPIEVNGLWINLLRVAERLCDRLGDDGDEFARAAAMAEGNMESRFWHEVYGHYLDTADPDDASLRPNQVIAMGLPFAPLAGENAQKALAKVRRELLTPYGLRSLGPKEPGYCGRYEGPLSARDAAYHQGTVWPWLLGPYVSAVMRVLGDVDHCRSVLAKSASWLAECGLGGISEVYDGDAPQYAGGCPWQAWSVAETLRAWIEIGALDSPSPNSR